MQNGVGYEDCKKKEDSRLKKRRLSRRGGVVVISIAFVNRKVKKSSLDVLAVLQCYKI